MENAKSKLFKEFKLQEAARILDESAAPANRPVLFVAETSFSPATDVWETATDLIVVVEVANLHPDNLRVQYLGGHLMIEGERPEPKLMQESEITKIHKKEIDLGTFRLRIKINSRVNQKKIKASYAKGLLAIVLPKYSREEQGQVFEIPVVSGD